MEKRQKSMKRSPGRGISALCDITGGMFHCEFYQNLSEKYNKKKKKKKISTLETCDCLFATFSCDVCNKTSQALSLTVSIGVVSKPQAKNSRKMTTTAWYTLGLPTPCCSWKTQPIK